MHGPAVPPPGPPRPPPTIRTVLTYVAPKVPQRCGLRLHAMLRNAGFVALPASGPLDGAERAPPLTLVFGQVDGVLRAFLAQASQGTSPRCILGLYLNAEDPWHRTAGEAAFARCLLGGSMTELIPWDGMREIGTQLAQLLGREPVPRFGPGRIGIAGPEN